MRKHFGLYLTGVVTILMSIGGCPTTVTPTAYNDTVGDTSAGLSSTFDIRFLEITNDSTALTLTLRVNGAVQTGGDSNTENYFFVFDTTSGGDVGMPWTRQVNFVVAHDYFVGIWPSWPDVLGGGQFHHWNTDSWIEVANQLTLDFSDRANGRFIVRLPLAALGLTTGSTFTVDVFSTRDEANNPGFDHLSNAAQATPDATTASTPGTYVTYTVK